MLRTDHLTKMVGPKSKFSLPPLVERKHACARRVSTLVSSIWVNRAHDHVLGTKAALPIFRCVRRSMDTRNTLFDRRVDSIYRRARSRRPRARRARALDVAAEQPN